MSSSDLHLNQRREEIEVLQSIFDDLSIDSDHQLILSTRPEIPSDSDPLTVNLKIIYTPTYPDEPPEIFIEPTEGFLSDEESSRATGKLLQVAQESIGMAMVFTLSLALQLELSEILKARVEEKARLENEVVRKAEEIEAARAKGTPVTKETFLAWRVKFDEECRLNQSRDEEEKLKALPLKEREELRKGLNKMTGRQLFESNRALVTSDNSLLDADAEELDLAKFAQQEPDRDEHEDKETETIA